VARDRPRTSSSRRASWWTGSSSCTRKDPTERDRPCCSRRVHVGGPRDRADEPQDPVREVGWTQVPRGCARQGCPRVPAQSSRTRATR
jgi:hypothetical protein